MKKISLRFFFGLLLLLILFTACSLDDFREKAYKSDVPVSKLQEIFGLTESGAINTDVKANSGAQITEDENQSGEAEMTKIDPPKKFNLDMVFFSQSPYGSWDLPYEESCEEASLLLVNYYFTGQKPTTEEFNQDLLDLVEWETEYFGQYFHTSVAETAEIATEYFGLKNHKIIDNPSVSEMKKYLAQGYPIIVPSSGRNLGNPFFSGTDPFYHMLVVRGYDEKNFITNDVGTKRGENFVYKYDVLLNAMHDLVPEFFEDASQIVNGEKRILVIMPN